MPQSTRLSVKCSREHVWVSNCSVNTSSIRLRPSPCVSVRLCLHPSPGQSWTLLAPLADVPNTNATATCSNPMCTASMPQQHFHIRCYQHGVTATCSTPMSPASMPQQQFQTRLQSMSINENIWKSMRTIPNPGISKKQLNISGHTLAYLINSDQFCTMIVNYCKIMTIPNHSKQFRLDNSKWFLTILNKSGQFWVPKP